MDSIPFSFRFLKIFSRSSGGFNAFQSWKSEMASRSVEHKVTASWILSLLEGETGTIRKFRMGLKERRDRG